MKETRVRFPERFERCAGADVWLLSPLTVEPAGLIMSVRSEIITCIPTNTAIPHLSAQLLSGPLSLLTVSSPSPVQQMEPFSYKLLTFPQAIFMDLCFSHNSPKTTIFTRPLSLSYEDFFPPPPPVLKTPLCQASKPGCGLVLAKQ